MRISFHYIPRFQYTALLLRHCIILKLLTLPMEPRNIKTLKLLKIKTLKDIRNYYKNTHNIEKWLNHSAMAKGDKKLHQH